MILLIILISFLALLLLLLLIPIQLKIDSTLGVYQMEWKNIVRANLLMKNEEPIARLKIFFWKKEFNLLQMKPSVKTEKPKKKKKTKSQKRKIDYRKKIKQIVKSIQVKQFFLNVDTNNYVWNAYLYPIFYFLKKENREVRINFQGNVELLLQVQARPIRVLYAVIF